MLPPPLQLIVLACCAEVEDSLISQTTLKRPTEKGDFSYLQMMLNSTAGCEAFKDSQ